MQDEQAAYSIDGFCRSHAISRSMFYKLLGAGLAPRVMCVGTHKRISKEAAQDWRRERETDGGGVRST
jgi:hypothetical protein